MNFEHLSFESPFHLIEASAQLESVVLLEEVKARRLPIIDLHLPYYAERISRVREQGLFTHVVETRLERMFDDFNDPMRSTYIARDESGVVAIGRVRIRPEMNTAVLYGFNVKRNERGSAAALGILEKCMEQIEAYSFTQKVPTQVRINRYNLTENKKPAISLMARRLNHVYGEGSVQIEEDNWDGEPFLKFTTSYLMFASLVDRYADKLATVIH